MKILFCGLYLVDVMSAFIDADPKAAADRIVYFGDQIEWNYLDDLHITQKFIYPKTVGLDASNKDVVLQTVFQKKNQLMSILAFEHVIIVVESESVYEGFLSALIDIIPGPERVSVLLIPPFYFENDRKFGIYKRLIDLVSGVNLGAIYYFQSDLFLTTKQSDYFGAAARMISDFFLKGEPSSRYYIARHA